ncbi:hypothetical protein [Flavobacterium pectinovorum]|uniref:TonB C-terminal domain-containing protein n=1 Tax=Flavobacterium pectinovorum TaxID=29533 RepID=A0A502EQZ8_9FLAO|nr:hypothetical protein [Flavobacterium pectinovorum]TPG39339.1 hypothetical protein EAH81_13925 [Flavobacterium pectinovorum]
MERKLKITISEPCHESWDQMTPKDNGRFCMSCSKTVTDFSVMSVEEIQLYFIKNHHKDICGRFKKSQLELLTIQIPSSVMYTQIPYRKMFLLALFIAMGTTLFSCTDKNGNKHKINTIEIVEDSVKLSPLATKDSLQDKPLPPSMPTISVNLPPIEGSSEAIGINYNPESYIAGGIGIYESIYICSDYPGGLNKLYETIQNKFELPRKAKKSTGEIQAYFSITKEGILEDIKIVNDIGHETGDELTRVLCTSPKWLPAQENGKSIVSYYEIQLSIQKDSLNLERRQRKFSKITCIAVSNIKNPYKTTSENTIDKFAIQNEEISIVKDSTETKNK